MRKKLFKLIFIFMMGFIILPINSFAKDAVEYRYYDEATKEFKTGSCDDYEEVVYTDTEWTSGWYVLSSRTDMDEQTITVTGDVNLILIDGMELYDAINIVVSKGNSLTIYAQSDGENMGHLNIYYGRAKCAGIGGFDGQDAGTIIIHGGKITAAGNYLGAGIGGGYNGDGGTVIIYGGQIDVTTLGGYGAAGIGGGYNGDGGIFKMYGGTLKAKGSWEADISAGAAIGGGHNGDSGVFEYYGGKLEVDSTNNLAAIGPGKGGSITKAITIGDDVTLFDKSGNLIGDRFMFPISDIFNAKSVKVEALSSKDYPITYREYNADGTFDNKTINTYKYLTINDTLLTDGWYVVSGDSTYPNGTSIGVSGNVNLILEDDSTLSVTKGIRVSDGNTLTVYTQSDGNNMGKINVDSTNFLNAGIGGGYNGNGRNTVIYGGTVNATGGTNGAAGLTGNITVHGGNADFIGLNNHDGIENSNVIISPKNESFIYVSAEDEEELGESPFDSETNITSLVATHNEIHLKDSSDTLDVDAVKLAAKNSAINLINAMKSNDNSSNVQKATQNAITAIQNANSVDAINDAKRNGILSIQSAKIYNENFVNPKTGDSLVVYILMLIISLFTISGILVINKKENN